MSIIVVGRWSFDVRRWSRSSVDLAEHDVE
jgi:hypothetical protein